MQYRLSVWLRCSGFLEVGFIIGLIIVIKSLNETSNCKQLDSKVREVFDDKKGTRRCKAHSKELEANGNKHDVKTIAASMKRQEFVAKAARKFKSYDRQ